MTKRTALGNLFRKFAEMADRGECGVSADDFAKTAMLHMSDHERINLLMDTVAHMLQEKTTPSGKANIIPLHETN